MPSLTKTPYTKLRRKAIELAKQYEKAACNQVKLADKICSIAKEYLNDTIQRP